MAPPAKPPSFFARLKNLFSSAPTEAELREQRIAHIMQCVRSTTPEMREQLQKALKRAQEK